jgi:Holliday junction resolvase RusA-like endonuclease
MTIVAEFFVAGDAKTAGSKKAIPLGRRVNGRFVPHCRPDGMPIVNVVDDTGPDGKRWREMVSSAALDAMAGRAPVDNVPLILEAVFFRARNKTDMGTGRNAGLVKPSAPEWPVTKPDLTKLLRAAEDAMTMIVYADDAQIVGHHIVKVWALPGHEAGVGIVVSRAKLGSASLYSPSPAIVVESGAQLAL